MNNIKTDDIVFLPTKRETSTPLANMDKIAKYLGIKHNSINTIIRHHKKELNQFNNAVGLIIQPGNTHKKVYWLNESQTVYIVSLMRNKKAKKLKKSIAKVFDYREREQLSRRAIHEISKDSTKALHEALDIYLNANKFTYMNFDDLTNRIALGLSTKQLKKERGITNDNKRSYLTTDELMKINETQITIKSYVTIGMNYHDIKNLLLNNHSIKQSNIYTKKLGGTVNE